MPTYVYECPQCKKRFEFQLTVENRDKPPWHAHGSCDPITELKRIIAPTSFILKGTGWAKDGYSK